MHNFSLGISAFYHDSAAVLLRDGKIVAAAQEERFSRCKHEASFPARAISYVLAEGGVGVEDLTTIAFYDKPFIKFERLLETYHAFVPAGLASFLAALPVWIKEKLFLRRLIWQELQKISGGRLKNRPQLLFPEHHLSHAASAFFPSPYAEAAILTIDGVGEWATTTIGKGKGSEISLLRELPFPHSLGLLYSSFTYFLGFKVNGGEYKLMGLAAYGNPQSDRVGKYRQLIYEHLVDLRADGSLLLNMDNFEFAVGQRMCDDGRWEQIFGLARRQPESVFSQAYMDLALALQQVTEEVIMRLAATARELTGCRQLVMAGGVALNCVANGKLLRAGIFDDLWIQPAAGDAGGALGAAYAAQYIWSDLAREVASGGADRMEGAYLGPEFGDVDVRRLGRKFDAPSKFIADDARLYKEVAALIAAGKVVGWFQGRMEWGPRALGNRSILADPRNPGMQKNLNLKIKYRESFRPFAPSVLAEDCSRYFELGKSSPYMLLAAPVQPGHRLELPDDYEKMALDERLNQCRSGMPAITHVDFTARVQTVHRGTNDRYWQLINAFKELTGCGLLVNTSFNVRGEPIVCTPEDGYRCFMATEMDWLVIGNHLFCKAEQPARHD